MQEEKLFIRFILRKSRINKNGQAPIYCRITYQKERKDFSTGEFVVDNDWNSEQQFVLNNQHINIRLKRIHDKLEKTLLFLSFL